MRPPINSKNKDRCKSVGYRISELRRHHNLTNKALAKRSDITSSMLSQIESGMANPSLNTLIRIAEALGVQPSHLFHEPIALDQLILRNHQRRIVNFPDYVDFHFAESTPHHKGKIQLTEVVLKTNGISVISENEHEEKAVIITGSAEILLNDQWVALNLRDSIHIPENTLYQWRNTHDGMTHIITAKLTSST